MWLDQHAMSYTWPTAVNMCSTSSCGHRQASDMQCSNVSQRVYGQSGGDGFKHMLPAVFSRRCVTLWRQQQACIGQRLSHNSRSKHWKFHRPTGGWCLSWRSICGGQGLTLPTKCPSYIMSISQHSWWPVWAYKATIINHSLTLTIISIYQTTIIINYNEAQHVGQCQWRTFMYFLIMSSQQKERFSFDDLSMQRDQRHFLH